MVSTYEAHRLFFTVSSRENVFTGSRLTLRLKECKLEWILRLFLYVSVCVVCVCCVCYVCVCVCLWTMSAWVWACWREKREWCSRLVHALAQISDALLSSIPAGVLSPVHDAVSVQRHEVNLAAASGPHWCEKHLRIDIIEMHVIPF